MLPGQVDPKSPGLLGEGLAAGQELSLHGTESRERLECPLGTFLDTALCSGVALLSPPVTQPGILAQGSCLVAIPSRCWLFRSCHCNVGANISIQPLLLQLLLEMPDFIPNPWPLSSAFCSRAVQRALNSAELLLKLLMLQVLLWSSSMDAQPKPQLPPWHHPSSHGKFPSHRLNTHTWRFPGH